MFSQVVLCSSPKMWSRVENDFISVLEHIPGTKADKQAYFQSRGVLGCREPTAS